jgi:hypothetical protein
MRKPPFAYRIAALLALLATAMAAQTNVMNWNAVKALATGTQVRVSAGSRPVNGRIEQVTDDALVVTSGKGQETFGRQQVSAVSVKKLSHRGRNALIGLAAGTGAGLGVGLAASGTRTAQLSIIPSGAIVAGFTVAGALGGSTVGVVIPTGGWREIYSK